MSMERIKAIENYFENLSVEKFEQDMKDCGMGEIQPFRDEHVCRQEKFCTCGQQELEPNEECLVHGFINAHPICDICGRFIKK